MISCPARSLVSRLTYPILTVPFLSLAVERATHAVDARRRRREHVILGSACLPQKATRRLATSSSFHHHLRAELKSVTLRVLHLALLSDSCLTLSACI